MEEIMVKTYYVHKLSLPVRPVNIFNWNLKQNTIFFLILIASY